MTTYPMTATRPPLQGPSPQYVVEANHRIANELGQLAALAQRQITAAARGPDPIPRQSVVEMLRLQHSRLLGIARLHHAISRAPNSDQVDLAQVLPELFREFEASGLFEERLRLTWCVAEHCPVDASRASALTLALSEIITSAAPASDGTLVLSISDDGVGLPEGFVETRDAGVGLKLVRSLIEGVGGVLTISSCPLGLTFHIDLPRREVGKVDVASRARNE
jgi:two-component sensor histidine kinase